MRLGRTLAFVVGVLTILGVTYIHERAHRYDVVAAGAGGGGSQQDIGHADFAAYLVDHQTGKVWSLIGNSERPLIRLTCTDAEWAETDFGCAKQQK